VPKVRIVSKEGAETRFLRAAANIQEAMAYLQSGIALNDNEARRLCREMKRDATWLKRMGRFLEHDHKVAASIGDPS
jgi:hypothetical protein